MAHFLNYTVSYTNQYYWTPFGFTKHNSNYVYIHIPKNASSWGDQLFVNQLNFTKEVTWNIKKDKSKKFICFLRDPVTRWLSGIAEYFNINHQGKIVPDKQTFDLIFDAVIFDRHTMPQSSFLEGLSPNDNLHYFSMDDTNFNINVINFVKQNIENKEYINMHKLNRMADQPSRQQIMMIIKKELMNNKVYKHKLKCVLQCDFMMFESLRLPVVVQL